MPIVNVDSETQTIEYGLSLHIAIVRPELEDSALKQILDYIQYAGLTTNNTPYEPGVRTAFAVLIYAINKYDPENQASGSNLQPERLIAAVLRKFPRVTSLFSPDRTNLLWLATTRNMALTVQALLDNGLNPMEPRPVDQDDFNEQLRYKRTLVPAPLIQALAKQPEVKIETLALLAAKCPTIEETLNPTITTEAYIGASTIVKESFPEEAKEKLSAAFAIRSDITSSEFYREQQRLNDSYCKVWADNFERYGTGDINYEVKARLAAYKPGELDMPDRTGLKAALTT